MKIKKYCKSSVYLLVTVLVLIGCSKNEPENSTFGKTVILKPMGNAIIIKKGDTSKGQYKEYKDFNAIKYFNGYLHTFAILEDNKLNQELIIKVFENFVKTESDKMNKSRQFKNTQYEKYYITTKEDAYKRCGSKPTNATYAKVYAECVLKNINKKLPFLVGDKYSISLIENKNIDYLNKSIFFNTSIYTWDEKLGIKNGELSIVNSQKYNSFKISTMKYNNKLIIYGKLQSELTTKSDVKDMTVFVNDFYNKLKEYKINIDSNISETINLNNTNL